jgi:two-component system, cell cycle response regulator
MLGRNTPGEDRLSSLSETLHDVGRSLSQRPDEIMLDVGAGGERVIAGLRIALILVLMLLPVANYLSGGSLEESIAGFIGTSLALVMSLAWLWMARQRRRFRWLPVLTGAVDVSLVTLVLWLLMRIDPPAALNSQVVFACYLLAIMVTALKNDGRATLFIGALAMAQYAALALLVFSMHPPEQLVSPSYGIVSAGAQVQRLVLLGVTTVLTLVVVFRIQRLVELSGTDGLTGLPNRSHLKLRVPELLENARRDGITLTMGLLDLDRFKRINEDHGHRVGDQALRHVTDVLREMLDEHSVIIRIGGEEFMVLMPMPMGPAWEHMECLRQGVEARPFNPEPGLPPETMTISAGLAAFPHDAADVSNLMKRADQRLNRAKAEGRNRVVARD